LTPGNYNSAAGDFQITGTLTLDAQGDPNAVFVFKAASTLVTASGSRVNLVNNAQSSRVYWQVGSSATLGTNSHFEGNIYAMASITAATGSTVKGQLFARDGAVTVDSITAANNAYGVAVVPATDAKSGEPGTKVTYDLTVTNTGNFSDTFNAKVTGNAWSTPVPTPVGPLAAGASSAAKVTATIPAGTIGGATDTAHVIFTSAGDPSKSATSNLTTTANTGLTTWYLAEGSTAWGFADYITIENPNSVGVQAKITYMPTGSANVTKTVTLAPSSQTTINPADDLGQKDFSTIVQCDPGLGIAVDRTMTWTGPGAASPEGHSSVGVTSPAKTWYLPEGSSAWGFECWLLIQNPTAQTAHCEVTYMIETEGPKTVDHTVPAHSRATFDMSKDIGSKDSSIEVTSDVLVIPERAMYRNNRREGHESIGTTTLAADYYLAEGTTAWGFTNYVLVQNPQSTPTDVTITYMTPSGPRIQPTFKMPANSRKTVRVNDISPANGYPIDVSNTDASAKVHGSQPIIAERAMYWGSGTIYGEACHDSIGMNAAHKNFYLPDGQTSDGHETWTLVQNPNTKDVTVEVSYLPAGGGAKSTFNVVIPKNSRMTFNMKDKVPNGRAAILVTSKTSGVKIMVDRAMYWNNRGAGTDTIGGYSD
jgi:hypothetical protein